MNQLQLTEKILPQGTISAKNKSHESAGDKLRKIDSKGRSCPPGSVPFLKATKAGPLNLSALEDFARSRASSLILMVKVNTAVFGDFETRFFYFTMNDDYKTSLYGSDIKMPDNNNLQFVVHNNDVIPFGNQITPTTSYAGKQHEIEITIKKHLVSKLFIWGYVKNSIL
ncbi:hypothetical protein EJ110_NYTH33061 [Nymphaea thermarum]|nr:hypothetical protein EJ110_NYTH33061 [Nymphaea thermarum]